MTTYGRASPQGLKELLACYLALNAAKHHHGIVIALQHTLLKYRSGVSQHQSMSSAVADSGRF